MKATTMLYRHDKREEWVAWFMSPETRSEQDLRAGLESIPQQFDDWMFVNTRLYVALDEEKRRLAGTAATVEPGQPIRITHPTHLDPTGDLWQLLEKKGDLFFEEVNNRSRNGPRDSMSANRRIVT